MRRLISTALAAALLSVAAAAPASANSERVTKGDVQAHFQAVEGGGSVAFQTGNPRAMTSAPANFQKHGVRPLIFFEGNHYCELDWLLAAIAFFDSAESFGVPTLREVREAYEHASVEFTVDGAPAGPVEATVAKRYLSEFIDLGGPGIWRQWAVFYAPGDLAVGPHTLRTTLLVDGVPLFSLGPVNFAIDAAGEGACQ